MCLDPEKHQNHQHWATSAQTLHWKNQEEQLVWDKQEVVRPQQDSFEVLSEEEILADSGEWQ